MRFSERYGYKEGRKEIQRESMDQRLRNSLWNAIDEDFFQRVIPRNFTDLRVGLLPVQHGLVVHDLWVEYLGLTWDAISDKTGRTVIRWVRDRFFNCEWYEVYDLLEFAVRKLTELWNSGYGDLPTYFVERCNREMTREQSAWRFVGMEVAPITSEDEIGAIESAMQDAALVSSVRAHLQRALELFGQRPEADYRNSVKESISAVEFLACMIAERPKATLGKALEAIERSGSVRMHGALKAAFSKLYGYASDVARHKINVLEEGEVGQAEAQFMLVACSAFVSYLVAKAAEANIDLTAGQSGRAAGP